MKRIAFITSAAASLTFAVASFSAFAQAPSAAPAAVGDAKAGAQLVQRCQGCHGIVGLRTAYPEVYKVPKIAGQHATYFVNSLKAYKAGDRKNAGMRSIALSLSDKDMNDLAAYYAEVK